VSVAAGVELDAEGRITDARVALGGVAARPWRLEAAERALPGAAIADTPRLREAIEGAFADARPRHHNGFKVELARRAVVRGLTRALTGGAR
jgi:xanthine dehydrogenase YagS FAD-binding subunit